MVQIPPPQPVKKRHPIGCLFFFCQKFAFFYGNLDPQARSTKKNKAVQKQMEILMNNEERLTAALNDENKKLFLDFANAWSVVNGESTLDSFIMGFRLGAKFIYDTFIGTDAPFEDLLKEW